MPNTTYVETQKAILRNELDELLQLLDTEGSIAGSLQCLRQDVRAVARTIPRPGDILAPSTGSPTVKINTGNFDALLFDLRRKLTIIDECQAKIVGAEAILSTL